MPRNDVKDKNGNLLYYIETQGDKSVVRDKNGNMLGFIQKGETRDKNGNLVATGEVPGLLYKPN